MRNHVQQGNNLTLPVPYAVKSGDGCKIGVLFGIAAGDAAEGSDADLVTYGVFTMPKASTDVFAIGEAVYWNDATKLVTKTVSGNSLIGAAMSVAPNPSGTVNVRLNGGI